LDKNLEAAAWHSVQRDFCLTISRDKKQLELPLEHRSADKFNMNWATYRDGQRVMFEAIVSYLEATGNPGLANRVKEKFGGRSEDRSRADT